MIPTIANSALPSINSTSQRSSHTNSQQQNAPNIPHCRHEYAVNSFCNSHEYANISVPHATVYQSCMDAESSVGNTSCGEVSKRSGTQAASNKSCRNGQSMSYDNMVVQTNADHLEAPRNDESKWPKEHKHKYEKMHMKSQPRDATLKRQTN